jgi:hypothetical protein
MTALGTAGGRPGEDSSMEMHCASCGTGLGHRSAFRMRLGS